MKNEETKDIAQTLEIWGDLRLLSHKIGIAAMDEQINTIKRKRFDSSTEANPPSTNSDIIPISHQSDGEEINVHINNNDQCEDNAEAKRQKTSAISMNTDINCPNGDTTPPSDDDDTCDDLSVKSIQQETQALKNMLDTLQKLDKALCAFGQELLEELPESHRA